MFTPAVRRWAGSIVGLALAIIGLASAPDDLGTWAEWIGDAFGGDRGRWILLGLGITIIAISNLPGFQRPAAGMWQYLVTGRRRENKAPIEAEKHRIAELEGQVSASQEHAARLER